MKMNETCHCQVNESLCLVKFHKSYAATNCILLCGDPSFAVLNDVGSVILETIGGDVYIQRKSVTCFIQRKCMWLSICMYVHTYVYIHIHTHTHAPTHTHTHTHAHTHTHKHTYIYICISSHFMIMSEQQIGIHVQRSCGG